MRGKIKKLPFIKLSFYFPSLLETNLNKAKYSIYRKTLNSFNVTGFLLKEKRLPTPALVNIHCFAAALAWKPLYLVIYSSFFYYCTCHHIRTASLPLGNKDEEKYDNRLILLMNLTRSNKLPNTRVFVAAENGSVEVLELLALCISQFHLRPGPPPPGLTPGN